jgi:hypothetical protein
MARASELRRPRDGQRLRGGAENGLNGRHLPCGNRKRATRAAKTNTKVFPCGNRKRATRAAKTNTKVSLQKFDFRLYAFTILERGFINAQLDEG